MLVNAVPRLLAALRVRWIVNEEIKSLADLAPNAKCSGCGHEWFSTDAPSVPCPNCQMWSSAHLYFRRQSLRLTLLDAIKHDDGKPSLDLLPPEALEEIAKVLSFGAHKYEPHNWRKGFKWSRLSAALLRHVFAFLRGEDLDPETGLSHLAHAGCMLLFLLTHQLTEIGEDDRYRRDRGEGTSPPEEQRAPQTESDR